MAEALQEATAQAAAEALAQLRAAAEAGASLPPSLGRALRLLALLQQSLAGASDAERRRLAMLLLELLLQPAVQRRVADATLTLTERALLQTIRTAFDIPPTEPPEPPPASPPASPPAAPPPSPARDNQRERAGSAATAAVSSSHPRVAGGERAVGVP